MSVQGQKDVFRFEVAVHHIHGVQVLQGHGDLHHVHPDPILRQALMLAHQSEEIAALNILRLFVKLHVPQSTQFPTCTKSMTMYSF